MKRAFIVWVCATLSLLNSHASGTDSVLYFPSLMFGHIHVGSSASDYDAVLEFETAADCRLQIDLFDDRNLPMPAQFQHSGGLTQTASALNVWLRAGQPLRLKLALPAGEVEKDVAVRTGWATGRCGNDFVGSVTMQVTSKDGKLLNRYTLRGERPAYGD